MSKYRRIRDTRDSNQKNIVAFLRSHGIETIECERPLDILIRRDDGICGFAEIKTESRSATIYRSQIEFIVNHSIPCMIVKNEGEALIFAEQMNGYNEQEKQRMDTWLVKNPTVKSLHPAGFEKVLNG